MDDYQTQSLVDIITSAYEFENLDEFLRDQDVYGETPSLKPGCGSQWEDHELEKIHQEVWKLKVAFPECYAPDWCKCN